MACSHRLLPVAALIGRRSNERSDPINLKRAIMKKKHVVPFVVALALGAALPALAGPDFQLIERAHLAEQKAAKQQAMHATAYVSSTDSAQRCPTAPLVLPLDHGLRAQTTPGENRIRKARYEAQLKACGDVAK
jgi:hypothetical protein